MKKPINSKATSSSTLYLQAKDARLISCHYCNELNTLNPQDKKQYCTQCSALLAQRKKNSISRTWALLLAAIILYFPANLLPVMDTFSFGGMQHNTIMSGIVYFWNSGEWIIASVVFIASFLVPLLKIAVLFILLISIHLKIKWRPLQRTRLYRLIESIGRWSMLDIFVILLSVLLVHFNNLATITVGPGALAFLSVVILTMCASMQFDPRLIWDQISPSTIISD